MSIGQRQTEQGSRRIGSKHGSMNTHIQGFMGADQCVWALSEALLKTVGRSYTVIFSL